MLIRVPLIALFLVAFACDDEPPAPIAPGPAQVPIQAPQNAQQNPVQQDLAQNSPTQPQGGVISCNGVMSMCVECDVGAPCAARVQEESCVARNGVYSNNPCPRTGSTGVCENAEQGNRAILFPPNWGPRNSAPWCQNGFRGAWTPTP